MYKRQSEPNVVLLDMAEASLDGEEWAEQEEVLRIDNILRKRLGYPLKIEAFAQPWLSKCFDLKRIAQAFTQNIVNAQHLFLLCPLFAVQ